MTAYGSTIDYRNTYFEYTDLTKIHGAPTAENLLRMQRELRANASSVYSDLAGGEHGHLFLVLTDVQIGIVAPNQQYDRPQHPGPLVIPDGQTAAQIQAQRDTHTEKVRSFREVNAVEAALIQQINKAIDTPYLDALRNSFTNKLKGPIASIMAHLKNTFGQVTVLQIDKAEEELRTYRWSPTEPVDTVFKKIDDYADYAELGNISLTQPQKIQKAYLLIHRTNRFPTAITEWNRRTARERQSWETFKEHFRQAYNEFQAVSNLSLEEAQEQTRNANLVTQVIEGVQASLQAPTANDEIREEVANVATQVQQQSTAIPQLTRQLQQMQQQMQQMQQQLLRYQQQDPYNPSFQPPPPQHWQQQQHDQHLSNRTNNNYNRRNNRQRNNQSQNKPGANHYCWTHGAGSHPSHQCQTPSVGHQPRATFRNTLGGNQRGVRPSQPNSNQFATPQTPYNNQN
jgi:uncharacterized coiled-coil protein SlyX